MPREFEAFEITEDTEVKISEESKLTFDERDWLRENGVLNIRSFRTETGRVNTIELDAQKLAQIAFEFETLRKAASSVEVEILEVFRKSTDQKLTTGEIAEQVDRPKSSISRALTRMAEKGKLTKVQPGVYRYP